jgi:hypothetical protein
VNYLQPYLIALENRGPKNTQLEVHNRLDASLVQTLQLPAKNFSHMVYAEGTERCLLASRTVIAIIRSVSVERQLGTLNLQLYPTLTPESYLTANMAKEAAQLLEHHLQSVGSKDHAKQVPF